MSYGLYIEDREPSRLADQLRAWILVLPTEAAFTHLTAAELRGWWLPQPIAHPVFAALRHGDPCPHRAGLLVSRHPSRVPSELVSSIRLTTSSETLLAAARDLGELDLVLMGDSALRLGHCTIDELIDTAAQRRRGAPLLRRVIGMLDKRSESPWESVMRVLHRVADIPVEPQHEVSINGDASSPEAICGSSAQTGCMSSMVAYTVIPQRRAAIWPVTGG